MTEADTKITNLSEPVKCDWKIRISSWGTMDFHGTEEEAEQRPQR